uniref:Uncharacterized protein n=1 Tax=Anguilla anguilla TaxID=7936 RepID=A0A0E9VT06_ANGAN
MTMCGVCKFRIKKIVLFATQPRGNIYKVPPKSGMSNSHATTAAFYS